MILEEVRPSWFEAKTENGLFWAWGDKKGFDLFYESYPLICAICTAQKLELASLFASAYYNEFVTKKLSDMILEFQEVAEGASEAQTPIGIMRIEEHTAGADLLFIGENLTRQLCTATSFDLAVLFAKAWVKVELVNAF